MAKAKPKILLSFDVEEFDLPEEYKQALDIDQQINASKEGLFQILKILTNQDILATFFITGEFAKREEKIVRQLAEAGHEIASHSYRHSSFEDADLEKSRLLLEKITDRSVKGFRMPRLAIIDTNKIKAAGYSYDSSVNPTYLPGRYNNFKKPRLPYLTNGLVCLPTSVTSVIRFPLFWLAFKNIPFGIYKLLTGRVLKKDGYLNIYFHPWEFTDISKFKIPWYIKRASGKKMEIKLTKLIEHLKTLGDFSTADDYCKSTGLIKD